ncbi:hypothetical protein CAEBREN_18433 [Caenorhabditis brenneri]|uniref:Uncharacterized protein n=1 Tax=Caenorhabditis brenneri TaxID=135651 RepID=G0MPJ5_CAEBE|nr:hypothetical protein CAEBREN_18433 [Caenorhabditis brenneri]
MGSTTSTSGSSSTAEVVIYTGDDDDKSGRTLDVKPDWNNTSILPPFNSPMESGVGHQS